MLVAATFARLELAVQRAGAVVRRDKFRFVATDTGGLCVVRGKQVVIVDATAPIADQVFVLLRALEELGAGAAPTATVAGLGGYAASVGVQAPLRSASLFRPLAKTKPKLAA
jgi:hypothetical protein